MKESFTTRCASDTARAAHSLSGTRVWPLLQGIGDIPDILRQFLQIKCGKQEEKTQENTKLALMSAMTSGCASCEARHARTFNLDDAAAAATRGGGMGPAQCPYQKEGNGAVAFATTHDGTM